MARVPGTFTISSNYDVSVKKPFDARMLVPTYADLTLKSNWQIVETTSSGTTKTSFIAYNGMLVAVADKTDIANSGLYMLFDADGGKNPDVEDVNSWLKIGETSDISDFVARLSNIETELGNIDERLTVLENLEAEEKVHTYGYRKDFPKDGQQNHMYIANDEHRTYVFVGSSYLPIADQFEYTNHDNDPETPEVRIICGGSANY